jgi:hypothetical protein
MDGVQFRAKEQGSFDAVVRALLTAKVNCTNPGV